jgi:threonine dehydrogenase-like Zn-dependent dehydrogenase
MIALQYRRSVPRYLLVRGLSPHLAAVATGPLALVGLAEVPEPRLPGPDWVRVRTRLCGICGSDLATLQAQGSPYFSAFLSFPFVLGHEIVGVVEETGSAVTDLAAGERVVVDPVLSCAVRGIADMCRPCREGNHGNCEFVTRGHLAPGIQIGYCRDTGGGMSPSFVAHRLQLHRVPAAIPDESAVLIEPFSCALHAVLEAGLTAGATALVVGSGTMGLLTIAAIRALGLGARVLALAKHPHQAAFARALGADQVIRAAGSTGERYAAVAAATGAAIHRPALGKPVVAGGADVTFDCIGSSSTLDDALRFTRARGRVILVGMPAVPGGVDWTTIWHKELEVKGSYTQATEVVDGERVRTMTLAIRLLASGAGALAPLVTARFPLADYRRAIAHATHTGRTRSVKTVFEFEV